MPDSNYKATFKSRNQIRDMIGFLKSKIAKDWEDSVFVIGVNPEDMIELRFESESIESTQSLNTYMNLLIETDDEIFSFKLRKHISKWGLNKEGFISFVLCPPWIHPQNPSNHHSNNIDKSSKSSAFTSRTN